MSFDLAVLLRRLAAADAGQRARAADEVTDGLTGSRSDYTDAEAGALMRALARARLDESDPTASEAQLNALSELAVWHALPLDVVEQLRTLDPARIQVGERRHLGDLLDGD
ncbi:hypothetical protein [Sporichthya polymorpha]|uniref:hypothetical protein n=1 Tax=Sporichthya polymorpha TaxID=35751 RepID=UPI00036EBB27|nr:hypothetical protein [Sporichthya polymorpha]